MSDKIDWLKTEISKVTNVFATLNAKFWNFDFTAAFPRLNGYNECKYEVNLATSITFTITETKRQRVDCNQFSSSNAMKSH